MANVNAPLAASGFVGAFTSLIVGSADKIIPDGNLKSLIAVASGMFAALLAFEIMAWYVILRLRTTKSSLDKILPQFGTIQIQLQGVINHQVEIMKSQNASAKSIKDIETELNALSTAIVRAMIAINKKSIDIVSSLSE